LLDIPEITDAFAAGYWFTSSTWHNRGQAMLEHWLIELMQIDATASEKLSGFRTLGISPRFLEGQL
jgi:hypothetical protein